MLEKPTFIKYYQSKEFLQDCIAEGKSIRDIANYCGVSFKLINVWLVEHGLIIATPETKLP